jgi:hypothetical protein
MTRLDEYLQANAAMPIITNPVLPAETFNRHWDQEKYEKFRKAIHQLSAIIKQAYDATDVEESVALWRKVFGEEFPLLESETGILNPESIQLSSIGDSGHQRPLSDICAGEELQYKIRIDAYLYSKNGKVKYRGINSDARFASDLAIKYVASTNVPEPYDVHWQVVNTGAHAAAENGLRGRFFKARTLQNDPSTPLINWETSKYTGKHWIECFVLKNNKCVARSGKFFINIKNPSH